MVYFVYGFGAFLVALLVVVIFYYFSPKRKAKVEQPKYEILDNHNDEESKR